MSECEAVIFHGPGHQSASRCHVEGTHTIHRTMRPDVDPYWYWSDNEGITDPFDESYELEEAFCREQHEAQRHTS